MEADILYAKACGVAPSLETVQIYINRSKLKLDIGENEDALRMAEKALELEGVSVSGLTIRGNGTGTQDTWYRRGKAAQALERWCGLPAGEGLVCTVLSKRNETISRSGLGKGLRRAQPRLVNFGILT